MGRKVIMPQKSEHDPTDLRVVGTWLLSSRLGEDLKEPVGRTTAFHLNREKLILLVTVTATTYHSHRLHIKLAGNLNYPD